MLIFLSSLDEIRRIHLFVFDLLSNERNFTNYIPVDKNEESKKTHEQDVTTVNEQKYWMRQAALREQTMLSLLPAVPPARKWKLCEFRKSVHTRAPSFRTV